jgi:hypothetical protein
VVKNASALGRQRHATTTLAQGDQRLRNFRAGIEGVISFLKRCFGWDRCAWRSYESFRAYTWGSVIAVNLVLLARHSLD